VDWRRYPFRLVPGDAGLDFPAAEGEHPDQESDTWYIAGELIAASGRRFAFLTIFNKNRPGGSVVADFYTLALFDIDTATYGTYTDYDMPPKSMLPGARPKLSGVVGHLDMSYETGAGTAAWKTSRDSHGQLVPYTYDIELVGRDRSGQEMELRLHVTPTRAPVPVGASVYNGKIVACRQNDTYSYFQTGMVMSGTLRWGDLEETVSGRSGHIDRQWFPIYAGGGGTGGELRLQSHEWHTISLDNGVDLSVWRQFDRDAGNALEPFSGATTSCADPGAVPECAEDIQVSTISYVRWPNSVRTLMPPPAQARFIGDRHRLTSAALQLDLTGEPLIAAPAHALPIEFMEGPYRYEGTMRGRPVTGFAFYERSLALYRDWELIDVLESAVAELTPASDELASMIRDVRPLVVAGRTREALDHVETAMAPVMAAVPAGSGAEVAQILGDLADSLRSRLG
jgi:predicted secreted hydrolase